MNNPAPRFDRLVALLGELDARVGTAFPSYVVGPSGQLEHGPWDHLADRLVYVTWEDHCIIRGFDWPSWKDEGKRYLAPGGVEGADLETCRKLLTVIVRQDRFVDGSLSGHIGEGLASRIVRRIAELVCPSCGAGTVVPILYGRPSPETFERARLGEVALGGCCVDRNSPKWRCRGCGHEFGRVNYVES
jgi:hypothetical protein